MGVGARIGVVITFLVTWQAATVAQRPSFQSRIELVSLSVTVTDANAHHVPSLTADQFSVFEDGVAQELKFFAPGDMSIDVVILLDTSASMTGSMQLVQQAATKFARSLRQTDRAAVMGISNGLRVLQPMTSDTDAIVQAIAGTRPAGRTPLYAAIYTALHELERDRRAATEVRRQALVVLSDGADTASAFTFEELLDVVRRHAVPIYTIVPRPSRTTSSLREQMFRDGSHARDFEMRTLANETGARWFFPVTSFELSGVYAAIANELAHQYSLGYQSTNVRRNGAFRRISVRLNVPGLKWRTRSGYLAERGSSGAGPDD